MKKSEKIFSATARLADALAGRINSRMRLAEGAFLPFLTREISLFLWGRRPSDVGAASERRRLGFLQIWKKLIFLIFSQNFKGKERKNGKKAKNFLRDRPARWRARRTNQFPDAISGGFFPSFPYARNWIFRVGPASERRRTGVGQASDRRRIGFLQIWKKLIFSKFLQILKEKSEKKSKKVKKFFRDRPARWRARRTNAIPGCD